MESISGFSKLSKNQKRGWLVSQLSKESISFGKFDFQSPDIQKSFDQFSENTIANFNVPFGVAPNFKINGKFHTIPMVTEESSVVAAASKAAKFWMDKGGFQSHVLSVEKRGHIYIEAMDTSFNFEATFEKVNQEVLVKLSPSQKRMQERGGGVLRSSLSLVQNLKRIYKIEICFDTCNAMGANFINTYLEEYAAKLLEVVGNKKINIIMSILSNYTPRCLVKAQVSTPIQLLGSIDGLNSKEFARKFKQAIDIANFDTDRAVTHNKGIMNGIDAVVVATGNDFRAVEACAHAYASRKGYYQSLSHCNLDGDVFTFTLEIPLAIGTVGGLTNLHPLAKISLDILGQPEAQELMKIIACAGLAQNFSALRSLITTGIQKGHMKMHLHNILNQLEANELEAIAALKFFSDKSVSFSRVSHFLNQGRLLN